MIYKIPCPTKTNGIRLFKTGDHQLAIEYQRGEPHVEPMAYDSALGKSGHTITFRPPSTHPDTQRIVADAQRKLRQVYGRDDLPSGTGIRRSKSEMKPRGSANINDEDPDDDEDDDNTQAIVGKLMASLKDVGLETEDLERVAAILNGADPEDADDGRRDAADRRRRRLAADAARYRLPTAAEDAEFYRMFPGARSLKLR